MGSFNFTCCLTGLPIGAGDPVKFFLLTENPYEDNNIVCYSHDMWFPRSWPVRADYNDYGSIENYDPESPSVYSIVDGLTKDLIEVGVGDNSCHDVPTKKGMPFAEILDAVWEKRITVKREYDTFKERAAESQKLLQKLEGKVSSEDLTSLKDVLTYTPPARVVEERPWFPTLASVRKILEDLGYIVNPAFGDDNGFLVDELDQANDGWVRVRTSGFSNRLSDLEKVLPALQKQYAAMITAGSQNYSHRGEIQVMPLPAPEKEHRSFRNARSDKPLFVFQGMIRVDIWNELLKLTDYTKVRAQVEKYWGKYLDKKGIRNEMDRMEDRESSIAAELLTRSAIPFSMGLAEHFEIILDRHRKHPFTAQQISDFLDDATGFVCISGLLYEVRYWWRPSFSCGPQFSDHKPFVDWHQAILRVSKLEAKKEQRDERG